MAKINLAKPVRAFNHIEASKIARDNGCGVCGSHIIIKQAYAYAYEFDCPQCGAVYQHMLVEKSKLEMSQAGITAGKLEMFQEKLQAQPKRSEADILRELGFE